MHEDMNSKRRSGMNFKTMTDSVDLNESDVTFCNIIQKSLNFTRM
jgi:hypothetical protein